MDLFIRECARLLGLREPAVRRAIRTGHLPALQVQDEHRIGRVDLLEWSIRGGVRVLPELFASGDAGYSALGPAFERGGLHELGDVPWAETSAALGLPERYAAVARARSSGGFLVDARGVATPQARAPFVAPVEAPALHVFRRPAPAPLAGPDAAGPGAWLLFAIVSPTIRAHLAVLARLAWLVVDDAFVDLFRGTLSAPRLLAALEEVPAP